MQSNLYTADTLYLMDTVHGTKLEHNGQTLVKKPLGSTCT